MSSKTKTSLQSEESKVRMLLQSWANATSQGRQDDVLTNHADDVLIYDVLPPFKYESAKAYRQGWGEWQPDTQGEMQFEIQDLTVTAGSEIAFAHGVIQCGGTLANGTTFRDTVRATFCLRKVGGEWSVVHQHISKPLQGI